MDNYNYHDAGTSLNAYKYPRPYDAPSKEELLSRNSFPSVNGNKHLDKLLGIETVSRLIADVSVGDIMRIGGADVPIKQIKWFSHADSVCINGEYLFAKTDKLELLK